MPLNFRIPVLLWLYNFYLYEDLCQIIQARPTTRRVQTRWLHNLSPMFISLCHIFFTLITSYWMTMIWGGLRNWCACLTWPRWIAGQTQLQWWTVQTRENQTVYFKIVGSVSNAKISTGVALQVYVLGPSSNSHPWEGPHFFPFFENSKFQGLIM